MKSGLIFLIIVVFLMLISITNTLAADSFIIRYSYNKVIDGEKWVGGEKKFSSDFDKSQKEVLTAIITGNLVKDPNSPKDHPIYYFDSATLSSDYYYHYLSGDVGEACASKSIQHGSSVMDLSYKGKKWDRNQDYQPESYVDIDISNNKYNVNIGNLYELHLLNPDCGADADESICPELKVKPVEIKNVDTGPDANNLCHNSDFKKVTHRGPHPVIFYFEDELTDKKLLAGSKTIKLDDGVKQEISWSFDLEGKKQDPDHIPALPGEDEKAEEVADARDAGDKIPSVPIVGGNVFDRFIAWFKGIFS